jgi:hypothetical protein
MEPEVSSLVEATGIVLHFNKGAAFFKFEDAKPEPAVCLFRPNRLLVDGRRLTTGQLKTVESIGQFLAVGDIVTGLVTPRNGARPYTVCTDSKVRALVGGRLAIVTVLITLRTKVDR